MAGVGRLGRVSLGVGWLAVASACATAGDLPFRHDPRRHHLLSTVAAGAGWQDGDGATAAVAARAGYLYGLTCGNRQWALAADAGLVRLGRSDLVVGAGGALAWPRLSLSVQPAVLWSPDDGCCGLAYDVSLRWTHPTGLSFVVDAVHQLAIVGDRRQAIGVVAGIDLFRSSQALADLWALTSNTP